ncbi:MAG: hypothetical protein JNJ74_12430 [Xanthomonadales bacterium]|nr:hypothetical protein [Xanthomonadales bacterium]
MAGCAVGGWLIAALAAATPDPVPVPSPQLIEFLAEFADAQGRFIDPQDADAALGAPRPERDPDAETPDAEAPDPELPPAEPRDAPPGRGP